MPVLQKIKMYYDPLGRVVKTVNPNGSEQWVLHGIPAVINNPPDPVTLIGAGSLITSPWVNFTYDSNDLADITNVPNDNVPSSHYFTPKSGEIDALGRSIRTTEYFDNTNYANTIEMKYSYDVQGNLLLVKDPYDRNVFEHIYDLNKAALWTKHIDKGESTILLDATGKPIEDHDAKGALALSAYDILHRSIDAWAKNKTGDSTTLRNYLVYGDSLGGSPETNNLKGKAYQSYDEAGMVEIPGYDFKGNVLTKNRQVIDSSTLKAQLDTYDTFVVDWTGLPSILDSFVFTSDMAYDALNRITLLTLPEDVNTIRKNIVPTYNTAGGLETVSYDGTVYVENIAYSAKGQRLLIAFGNDVMTRYTYDPITFRLLRQRSEKYTKTTVGSTVTYAYNSGTVRQDDGFNFDLVGNIVKLLDRMTDCGIGGSPNALDREFDYDPIYRLTYADGRESNTQSGNSYLYEDAPAPSGLTDVRAYSRTYSYDKIGNVQSIIQAGANGFTRNFVYNTGVNTLQKVQDATPTLIEDFTYDANGNQITAGANRNYVWNHADQLICYFNQAGGGDPTVFTQYDYSGQDRVSKLVRTGTAITPIYERTIYIDGIFEYVILENGTTYEKNYVHVMDDKSRIAEIRVGTAFPGDITDSVTYIIEDQIGSSVMRLDTSGTEIDREEYYPFGDSSLRTFTFKRYRYVGKEKDQESGLYYYGARYYAAWTCRFISVDPLADHYVHLTPYNYAANKPINDFDIDGMQSKKEGTQGKTEGNTKGTGKKDNVKTKGDIKTGGEKKEGGGKNPNNDPDLVHNREKLGKKDKAHPLPEKESETGPKPKADRLDSIPAPKKLPTSKSPEPELKKSPAETTQPSAPTGAGGGVPTSEKSTNKNDGNTVGPRIVNGLKRILMDIQAMYHGGVIIWGDNPNGRTEGKSIFYSFKAKRVIVLDLSSDNPMIEVLGILNQGPLGGGADAGRAKGKEEAMSEQLEGPEGNAKAPNMQTHDTILKSEWWNSKKGKFDTIIETYDKNELREKGVGAQPSKRVFK